MTSSSLLLEMLYRHCRVFHEKINGIQDVYRNCSSDFKAVLMKRSEEMDQFSTEFQDFRQQFALSYGFVSVKVKITKNIVLNNEIEKLIRIN